MATHYVSWGLHVESEDGTAEDAARRALEIMRGPKATAPLFEVTDEEGGVELISLHPPHPGTNEES